MLFAMLSLFMGTFYTLINNIFTVLGGNDFRAFWHNTQPLFSWAIPADPNDIARLRFQNPNGQAIAPVQNMMAILSCGSGSMPGWLLNLPSIDFGPSSIMIIQRLALSLAGLWIFASMLKSMVMKVPEIAEAIAGSISGVTVQSVPFIQRAGQAAGQARGMTGGTQARRTT